MTDGFVGVHIGAGERYFWVYLWSGWWAFFKKICLTLFYLFFPGHHSEARTSLYLSICSKACKVATDILRQGGSAIDAAAAATMVLEDAGETNAGYGSNLTELGTIV